MKVAMMFAAKVLLAAVLVVVSLALLVVLPIFLIAMSMFAYATAIKVMWVEAFRRFKEKTVGATKKVGLDEEREASVS